MRTALVITHVAFEDLGTLGIELENAGFHIEFSDACTERLSDLRVLDADLLIVLDGPIRILERNCFPFLEAEVALLHQRLAARLPTLGVGLGAQLMAAALGARVYPGSPGQEIGWAPLSACRSHSGSNWFSPLLSPDLRVLHCHHDTFDLPRGASHLAGTPHYPNQAFTVGQHALALQFHAEVTAAGLQRWYVGRARELAQAGIDVRQLREEGLYFAPILEAGARRVWRQWLSQAFAPPRGCPEPGRREPHAVISRHTTVRVAARHPAKAHS